MLDPVANTLDLRKPFDPTRATRVQRALAASKVGISDVGYFDNMLHHDAAVRGKKHDFMMRVFDAAALLGVDAVCGFVGRNPQHSMDENLIDFEQRLRAAAQGREGARADLPRRAVPDARLDDGRQLAQQHRLHARHVDRAAPDLREARRRRPVPHPLRPVARDPDGAGHTVDLPVPEGDRLRFPDRRLPRERARSSTRKAGPRGATAARPSSAAIGKAAGRRKIRPITSTPGKSRSFSPSTSCPARRGTIRSPTCRTAPSTGSITSSPPASCSRSTSPTRS